MVVITWFRNNEHIMVYTLKQEFAYQALSLSTLLMRLSRTVFVKYVSVKFKKS